MSSKANQIQTLVDSLKECINNSNFIIAHYFDNLDNRAKSISKLLDYIYGDQTSTEKTFFRLSEEFLEKNKNNLVEILKASDLLNEVYLFEFNGEVLTEKYRVNEPLTFGGNKQFRSKNEIMLHVASLNMDNDATTIHIRFKNELRTAIFNKISKTIQKFRKITYKEADYCYTKKEHIGFNSSLNDSEVNRLHYSLAGANFIRENLKAFQNIFTGKTIQEPIIWIGKKSELSYLLRTLRKQGKIVSSNQNFNKTSINCFVNSEGSFFDVSKFRSQKPTKKKQILDEIIKT